MLKAPIESDKKMNPGYHVVELQPWEGGPDTVTTAKFRASFLKPAHPKATGNCAAGGSAAGDSANGGPVEKGPVDAEGAAEGIGAAQDVPHEAEAEAEAEAAFNAKPAKRSLRSAARVAKSGGGSAGEAEDEQQQQQQPRGGIERGEVEGNEPIDQWGDMEMDEDEADQVEEEKEEQEQEGEEDGGEGKEAEEEEEKEEEEDAEQAKKAEQEDEAEEGDLGVGVAAKSITSDPMAMPSEGEPLDDPRKPSLVPVGTRVILTKPLSAAAARLIKANSSDLVGKTVRPWGMGSLGSFDVLERSLLL